VDCPPAFAGPATLLYVGLVFLPLVLALSYSLTDKNLLSPHAGYVGAATTNYRELLSDDVFKPGRSRVTRDHELR